MTDDLGAAGLRFERDGVIGWCIDATYAAVLPAHVGIAVARDLLLSGRRFDAEEAVRLGVISRVVPHDQLREASVQAVGEILQTGPLARMHVKRMLNG
jgi:enoyl-CoA hydratase/carnithine racemase